MTFVLLFFAAFVGGALNAVAGGGSFIAFPALLFSGVPAVTANATNSVALWPAGVASAIAYRKEVREVPRQVLVVLTIASLAGGLAGALWLLKTPDATFLRQVPWLLFAATILFTFGPAVSKRFRARSGLALTAAAQVLISIYGGYFGGGMGILMLAAMSLMGMEKIHTMNGLKSILGVAINGIAVAAFIVGGAVAWRPGALMIVGGMAGGYAGAALARKVPPVWMRRFVMLVAWGLTAYFFAKAYGLKP